MRKIFLFIIGLSAALPLAAQTDRTEKVQSVQLNLLGLQYSYTFPVGKKWTVTPHAGISGEFGWTSSGYWSWSEDDGLRDEGHFFYTLRGSGGIDVRYYYNLSRRLEQGRRTAFNSGNFFAVDFQYHSRAFAYKNAVRDDVLLAYPCWGIRRVYQGKYLLEVTGGAMAGLSDGTWRVRGPKFDLKMGFVF